MKKILLFLLLSIAGYGQIVPTGGEQDFDYGIRNTASQLDDNAAFITVQDATGVQGKSTSSVWAKKIYVDNADATKSFLSTGLIKNGLVTTNADPTKFNITAGIGIITNFDNPEVPTSTIVSFPAFNAVTPAYLTTGIITYVAVNSTPTLVMQATPFTDVQRRSLIILGAVIHSNLSTINSVNNISAPTNAGTNQLHDFMEAIGALNVSGNKYSANGANLSLNKSAGDIFKLGVNFANDWKKPHTLSISATTALTFRYRTQNGTEGADVTVLNPALYDLNNVLTSVPSNRFSIQTVALFQTGVTRIQYGQATYATLADAEAAIFTRSFTTESNIAQNGIIRAYIILKNNATSLQNANDALIVEAQKFGGIASGGTAFTLTNIIAALGYTPENVANKQNSLAVDGTGIKYPTVDAVNAALPTNYAKVVYVNATSPTTATIFDLNNPPVTNDDLLKNDTSNLYIGNDASTWVYNGSTYVTKTIPATSNFNIVGTLTDAGSNKTSDIHRTGGIQTGGYVYSSAEIVSKKGSSDTVNLGSTFRLANSAGTENNTFQLNASNGIDLWNYTSGIWTKRFTFSSDGDFNSVGNITGGLKVRKISTNTTLANTDNGTIILLTASCTVTLPNGLMPGFNCSFSTQTGATLTYALGGSVTLINNVGTTMAQNLSHTIVNTGTSNEYLVAGSL